jgi:LmbE family N-acetylglucosaminyl deacetylase
MTARRILVLIPHPDDEVVGCAAAIARAVAEGTRVFGLYLTTGVPPRDAFWPWQRAGYDRRVERRRDEALSAAAALAITPLAFSARPSRSLKAQLRDAAAEIRAAIARCAAEALWVPAWEGGHQDHDAANFLGAQFADRLPVIEFAEYNFAGGVLRSQRFPAENGGEIVLRLTATEAAAKRDLLALYRSERGNLAHVGIESECLRPLPRHDYAVPPHPGRLFRERFHWVPMPHPRIDFEPTRAVLAALAGFSR